MITLMNKNRVSTQEILWMQPNYGRNNPIKEPITKDSEFMDVTNRHVTKRLD